MEHTLGQLADACGLQRPDKPAKETVSGLATASPVVRTLLGLEAPRWEETPVDYQVISPMLNETQRAALSFALRAEQVALVHGPPGTGKTTAVAELIVQLALLHPNARILVCGASNLAVDNLLERVLTTPEYKDALQRADARCTRIGHPARVLPALTGATLDVQSTSSDEGQLVREVAQEINELMSVLSPRSNAPRAGNKSGRTAPRPKGTERRRLWEQVRALRNEYRRRDRTLTGTVLQRARIVMATCHGAGSRQLEGVEFDYVVIDEACQALEASCWTAVLKLTRHGRLFLAGDHLQLPPTVKATSYDSAVPRSAIAPAAPRGATLPPVESLSTTMFDRMLQMYGDGCKRLLNVQYRMCTEIMAFPSAQLYEGQLVAHESCAAIRLADLPDYDAGDGDDDVVGAPLVFYDTTGTGMFERLAEDDLQSQSRSNENEAQLVARHVDQLVSRGLSPSSIAVLSPYAAQVDTLSRQLREAHGADIEVGTVDGMQGREKDVVVLSLVRSNENHEIGFLRDKRRLNVGMTRARRQLVVVGDAETVGGAARDASDARAFLRAWMEHLHEHALVEMNPE